jgi:hypothetical protein
MGDGKDQISRSAQEVGSAEMCTREMEAIS